MKNQKAIRFIAVFTGVFFAVIVYVIVKLILPEEALPLAILSGAGYSILMLSYLLLHKIGMRKKYLKLEQTFQEPILFKMNCDLVAPSSKGMKVKNVNIYFFPKEMLLASLEGKQDVNAFARQDFDRFTCINSISFRFVMKSGEALQFLSQELPNLIDYLSQSHWINTTQEDS